MKRKNKSRITSLGGLVFLLVALVVSVRLVGIATKLFSKAATTVTLPTVISRAGIKGFVYGDGKYPVTDLSIREMSGTTTTSRGVFEIKRKYDSFPCTPSSTCEPDKFEIIYSGRVNNIFGLGMQTSANQVMVDDLLDTSFGFGHIYTPRPESTPIDDWDSDIGRMRTSVFVIPEKNTIIAYIQPEVKMVRLTRNGLYNCATTDTCIVLKKHNIYPEGKPAPLVIVKGTSMSDAYTLYFKYLRGVYGGYTKDLGLVAPIKKPNFKIFGLNWETFDQFGSAATKSNILATMNLYKNNAIPLDTITIGSGYWQGSPDAWRTDLYDYPATDALKVDSTRYSGTLEDFFTTLKNNGITPIIGMRHSVKTGTSVVNTSLKNTEFVKSLYGYYPYFSTTSTNPVPLFSGTDSTGDKKAAILNTTNSSIVGKWIDLTKKYYGSFGGIKEDDMFIYDQRAALSNSNLKNLPDNLISKSHKVWTDKGNLIYSRNNWFTASTDAQNNQGWSNLSNFTPPYYSSEMYDVKYILDSALTGVISGYPHPFIELSVKGVDAKKFFRTEQFRTYFAVHGFSYWFTNSSDTNYQNGMKFSYKLRKRLQQYAYDNAIRWYNTGEPWVMRPLFVAFTPNSEIYRMYGYSKSFSCTTAISGLCNQGVTVDWRIYPWDEFMFGNALLVRPVLNARDSFKVYIPEGTWAYFLKGGMGFVTGPKYIDYSMEGIYDYPVFLKNGEILVIGGTDANYAELSAYVLMSGITSSKDYTLYRQGSSTGIKLRAVVESGVYKLKNLNTGKSVILSNSATFNYNKGYHVARIPSDWK